jgi:hypothetical protein
VEDDGDEQSVVVVGRAQSQTHENVLCGIN